MTFIGQLRFTESKDLVQRLPGEILLIFSEDDVGAPDSFLFEWKPLGLQNLVEARDVAAPAWAFVNCYGLQYRTVDLKADPDDARTRDDSDFFWAGRILGTKIGGLPRWIQGDERPAGQFLGSVGPVQPSPEVDYPWVNDSKPLSLREYYQSNRCLMWGDMGNCNLFLKDDGEIEAIVQCF
jgi:hypothetical protein